ncbi:bifunctional 5,10-methylenetetrahydrofolate dehydrogenase/5,10-methenyltetrahydrofolate cyclohydrolase [Vagococcus silagei]|uniref:Bifunctional protein FolD n=1 Tax=Vagococcus silagei TaxID=2508885 RepID=A0A4S3B9H4_9ENTE|nr:bifunctional 5,10-methylenetetrahydrofolate dehydrogenase/5,10-methenyltetrahydrofolate cyclohydrolase [Vagococcus silagei]THB61725.1 bifunctional 5,10-methylenetetrahydrofolate dehydrogenase/5,10-methenyltetrahydrofolate cyclohydrolase [Vagococcus silagei]
MNKDILGQDVVAKIKNELKTKDYGELKPKLAVLRVGSRSSDLAYEASLKRIFNPLNINVEVTALPKEINQADFDQAFNKINQDSTNSGILLLSPIPQHLNLKHAMETIDPKKDVDCFGSENTLRIYVDQEKGFLPCTAEAVLKILSYQNVDLRGKDVVIVGFGFVIGRPLSLLLVEAGCTVTVCHVDTVDLAEKCRRAEIIVSATGVPHLIKQDFISNDTIVVDVGINVGVDGEIYGDVDYDDVYKKVKSITPVPGGVGTVTTYVLAEHVVNSFEGR